MRVPLSVVLADLRNEWYFPSSEHFRLELHGTRANPKGILDDACQGKVNPSNPIVVPGRVPALPIPLPKAARILGPVV
jgi:hypothetical protein